MTVGRAERSARPFYCLLLTLADQDDDHNSGDDYHSGDHADDHGINGCRLLVGGLGGSGIGGCFGLGRLGGRLTGSGSSTSARSRPMPNSMKPSAARPLNEAAGAFHFHRSSHLTSFQDQAVFAFDIKFIITGFYCRDNQKFAQLYPMRGLAIPLGIKRTRQGMYRIRIFRKGDS